MADFLIDIQREKDSDQTKRSRYPKVVDLFFVNPIWIVKICASALLLLLFFISQ